MKESVTTASQEDFAKAFQLCTPLAEQGDADAQHKVGWMYFNAKGVPQDYAKALKWYQLAAEQGWGRSQVNLGYMYINGQGVPQDYAEALKWYQLAAEQEFAEAQGNLGLMYHNGVGVPQNFAEAAKWYRMAADQGLARAQYLLGLLYDQGQGVPQDNAEAAKWYRMAADQGVADAQLNLRLLYGQVLGGFPLEDFPGVGEPPRVVLVDPGKGEKSELRFRFNAGSIHKMVMTMTMRMLGVQGRAMQMPGIRVAMVVEVLEANEDRARIYWSIPNDPDLVGTEGAPPELVAKLREDLRVMSSYRGESTVTSLGVTVEMQLEVDTENPGLEQFLEAMRQSMRQLTAPLPEEPVGVGARWKTLQRLTGPVTLYQLTSFELLQRTGSSVTLGMKMEQLTPKQTMVLPETLPEVTFDISAEIAGIAQGDGEMTLDLHSPVPRSRTSIEIVIRTTVRDGDEVEETVMNMLLLVEVEPRT
jgi:TPR repeat protein